MEELTIAIRALHYAAVIMLFGGFAFLGGVAMPACRGVRDTMSGQARALYRRLPRVAGWSLAITVASGMLWLAIEAVRMSGAPNFAALNRETLATVLSATLFGRIAVIRLVLAIAMGAILVSGRCGLDKRGWTAFCACAGVLSGMLLATLAWTGHAAAEQGAARVIHMASDAVHLLAAGAWLGALPWLIRFLSLTCGDGRANEWRLAVAAIRKFSVLGIASVAALVVTGVVNAGYTVGSVPALLGTRYGRVLLVKLALFAAMIALAAVNRLRLTPGLVADMNGANGNGTRRALHALRRNALAETALGFIIVGIVGVLGIAVPALHVQAEWPFPYTLSWEATDQASAVHTALPAAAGALIAVAVLLLVRARDRGRGIVVAILAGCGGAVAFAVWFLIVPAYPTTYFRSPVRYAVDSIARGAPLFARNCAVCHGPYGYGDGPAAASIAVRPANLTQEHLFHHGDGNLFWWVSRGITGTPMPGFRDRLREAQIWDILNFLRTQAEAEQGKALSENVDPWRPIVAPDFVFQVDRQPQETLRQQRGRHIVMLVLYTLPESLPRLRAISESGSQLERAGVRVIAVPTHREMMIQSEKEGVDRSMTVVANPELVAAYTLFRRRSAVPRVPPVPHHMEFLIDRQGYLRARWILSSGHGWDRIPELMAQIGKLNSEKPRPPAPEGHVH